MGDEATPPRDRARRTFIAGLTAGAIGGAIVGGTRAFGLLDDFHMPTWDVHADVLIVGGGASGCTAALSARQAGARVVLLESAPVLGGAGSLCIGSITVPSSSSQKAMGIVDSTDAYIEDVLALAGSQRNRMDIRLLRLLANEGGATVDWLTRWGVRIEGPFPYPAHRVRRMHMLAPKSSEWPKVLRPILERQGVTLLLATKGVRLFRSSAGAVTGVEAVDQRTGASIRIAARRAVMLAAGNMEASPALARRATRPELASLQPAVYSRDGSGLVMGWSVGAATTMVDSSISNPQIRGMPPAPAVFSLKKQSWMPFGIVDAGAVLVNAHGQRFVDETAPGSSLALALEKQPFKTCYLVFDDRVARIFNRWPMVVGSCPGIAPVSGLGGWALVDDLIAHRGITKAATIESLGRAIGIDSDGLRSGIGLWNAACASGSDREFARTTLGHAQAGTAAAGVRVGPYYCHGPLRAWLMPSDVSLMIDSEFRVRDVFGEVITGLYAAGDMGHGDLLTEGTGHGINMGWAFTSGRLGGRIAATAEPGN